ncbi:MAG: MarR family transcriptional regulator [Mesorhizobium sp.]|nr:MAG: MarR family transcriptional regulator [Mesorhizobium sp.]
MNQLLDGQLPAQPHFTEKQGQYLAFWTYARLNGRSPAERDMQRRRQPGLARSIELLIGPDSLPRLQPIEPVKSAVQRH